MRSGQCGSPVIIVAGAVGGVGASVCATLVRRGATVIAAARCARRLDGLVREMSLTDGVVIPIPGDLADASTWRRVVEAALDRFGRIDAMVNCTGALVPGELSALSPHEIERVMRDNTMPLLLGAHAVIPSMRIAGRGVIVTVGSLGGILPMPFESTYSAAKFAVRGFTLSHDQELRGSGVRAVHLACGPIDTPMLERESCDGDSTSAFALATMTCDRVAAEVVRLIVAPRSERLLPRSPSLIVRIAGAFPRIHALIAPLLERRGARGLRRYRAHLSSPSRIAPSATPAPVSH